MKQTELINDRGNFQFSVKNSLAFFRATALLQYLKATTSACLRGRAVLVRMNVSGGHFKEFSFITEHKNAFVEV